MVLFIVPILELRRRESPHTLLPFPSSIYYNLLLTFAPPPLFDFPSPPLPLLTQGNGREQNTS